MPCSFAGVPAWLAWAKLPENRFYFSAQHPRFRPGKGDLIIYDNICGEGPHDHIGVVLAVRGDRYLTAEGNVRNVSGVFERKRDRKVRGFVRIPSGYRYPPPE